MPSLFEPIQIGSIEAKNRIFMSSLTRTRATLGGVPTELMREYYSRRGDFGITFAEATGINKEGHGWPYTPGIWSQEQVEHWKPITQAVHEKGGKIVCELWHMGHAVHSTVTGLQPVSASATFHPSQVHLIDGKGDPEEARALTLDDIKRVVREYAQAAKNAIDAGFDGVEVHAANRNLTHQFMSETTNHRTDEYGGSLQNRLRFFKEVLTAVVKEIGADRTGVRLSPVIDMQGVKTPEAVQLYVSVVEIMNTLDVAFLEVRELSSVALSDDPEAPKYCEILRSVFKGKLILNQDYTRETAETVLERGLADAVSFGKYTLTNPDLVQKFKDGTPLNEFMSTRPYWYSRGPEGYTMFSDSN